MLTSNGHVQCTDLAVGGETDDVESERYASVPKKQERIRPSGPGGTAVEDYGANPAQLAGEEGIGDALDKREGR